MTLTARKFGVFVSATFLSSVFINVFYTSLSGVFGSMADCHAEAACENSAFFGGIFVGIGLPLITSIFFASAGMKAIGLPKWRSRGIGYGVLAGILTIFSLFFLKG